MSSSDWSGAGNPYGRGTQQQQQQQQQQNYSHAVPPHMSSAGGSGSGLTRRSHPGVPSAAPTPFYAQPYQQQPQQPQQQPRPAQPTYANPYQQQQQQQQPARPQDDFFQSIPAQRTTSSSTQQHRIFPSRAAAPGPAAQGGYDSSFSLSPAGAYANPYQAQPPAPGMFGSAPGSTSAAASSSFPGYPASQQQSSAASTSAYPSWGGGAAAASAGKAPAAAAPAFGGPTAAEAAPQDFFGTQFMNNFQGSVGGQLGLQLGSQALQQGSQIVNQNLNRYVNVQRLKYYFNVSNSYVFAKLRLLTFPFRHRSWTRLVNRSERDGQFEGYKPPREDLNAPDLYIPVMALVTYVLLVGALLGSNKDGRSFSPDALGTTGTSAIFLVATELLLVKLGCYLLGVTNDVPSVDVIAYCGYKFLGVNTSVAAKIFFSSTVVYSVFAYYSLAFAFFTLRTTKYLFLPDAADSAAVVGHRQTRIYFLFAFALLQVFDALLLVYGA